MGEDCEVQLQVNHKEEWWFNSSNGQIGEGFLALETFICKGALVVVTFAFKNVDTADLNGILSRTRGT